jgi:hypothetical protein
MPALISTSDWPKLGVSILPTFRGTAPQATRLARALQPWYAIYPDQPVVEAYSGSLELLEAARTWAIWDKRRLANEGLQKMDQAVNRVPGDLEARFIRAASDWHLPFFYRRKEQAANDFALIAPQAEAAAAKGTLPPELAAAALDYYGQVLIDRSDSHGAKQAFEAAVRIDGSSPAGRDAQKRLRTE